MDRIRAVPRRMRMLIRFTAATRITAVIHISGDRGSDSMAEEFSSAAAVFDTFVRRPLVLFLAWEGLLCVS